MEPSPASISESQLKPLDPIRHFILKRIVTGAFPPGHKLPTERELALRFATARGTVRKTLARLDFEGKIVRHVGRGTFVAQAPNAAPGNDADTSIPDTSPAELMEARLVLEPQLAALVATTATAGDFRRIESLLERAGEAQTADEFEHWDAALHLAIAVATHNDLLAHAFAMITRARQNAQWGKLKRHSANPAQRLAYQAQHRAIVDALRHRDVDRARSGIIDHLLCVRRNMLGY